jgi:hypothetical protein
VRVCAWVCVDVGMLLQWRTHLPQHRPQRARPQLSHRAHERPPGGLVACGRGTSRQILCGDCLERARLQGSDNTLASPVWAHWARSFFFFVFSFFFLFSLTRSSRSLKLRDKYSIVHSCVCEWVGGGAQARYGISLPTSISTSMSARIAPIARMSIGRPPIASLSTALHTCTCVRVCVCVCVCVRVGDASGSVGG